LEQHRALLRHRQHGIASALNRFIDSGDPFAGATDPHTAGNGQLAGAYYGVSAIPESWRAQLTHAEAIVCLADGLLELAGLEATD